MSGIYKSNTAILNEARDYLDGLVLGDGNIHSVNNSGTGYYRQSCKYKEWLDRISEDLYEYGIECGVDNGRLHTGGWTPEGGSIEYHLWTRCYIEFKEMHDRWYIPWYDIDSYNKKFWHKNDSGEYFIRKKIVPKDIYLSPVCVANWYFGDGSYPNKNQINLSTDGFLRENTVFISELLSEMLDIKCSVTKRGVIYIGIRSDVSKFLNYMKNCEIPDCYSYKFPEGAM